MTDEYDFDLFVIGAGSEGVRAYRIAASFGAKVAIAEERYFGGTCVNAGCIPKKLMAYAAQFHDDFQDRQGFGWQVFKDKKDREINRLESVYQSILATSGVSVFEHRATLEGPHKVNVGKETVTARYILLAVGSWP